VVVDQQGPVPSLAERSAQSRPVPEQRLAVNSYEASSSSDLSLS
jgi:hypothetical protein